jgi:ribose transport system ATP-binding protein
MLEMLGISKSFGGTKALSNVNFTVKRGEIHALLGENGAGKSTLMNILAGVIPIEAGTVRFDGQNYNRPSIRQMEKAGLAFVHQELNVVNDLSVADNVFLNRELRSSFGLLKHKEMTRQSRELFESHGVPISPNVMVSSLKTSEKQLLEICRALQADAKLLILDEPTTALSNEEVEHLFGTLRRLRDKGKTFIFISHKMPEIFALCDRYTILKNGELIDEGYIADTNAHSVTCSMVGEQFADKEVYAPRDLGGTILKLEGLCGKGFSNINLSVRKGEIVSFTGLAGSGASELLQTLFGVIPILGGAVTVCGKPLRGSIKRFMRRGVGMLPTNRKENSVLPDLTILENFYSAEHTLSRRRPFIHKKTELEKYDRLKELLSIKSENPDASIHSLSGGNQQKVFLARWLNTDATVLFLDNPTQGVDVGSKEEIYRLILEFANEGKTVLINTMEIPEIRKVSDRCVVFYDGGVARIFEHDDINERDVMLYATNAVQSPQEGGYAE